MWFVLTAGPATRTYHHWTTTSPLLRHHYTTTMAARPGQNRELLKRIPRFQRGNTSETAKISQSLPAQSRPDKVFFVIDSLHSLHPPWIKPRTFGANQTPLGTSLVMRGTLSQKGDRAASIGIRCEARPRGRRTGIREPQIQPLRKLRRFSPGRNKTEKNGAQAFGGARVRCHWRMRRQVVLTSVRP